MLVREEGLRPLNLLQIKAFKLLRVRDPRYLSGRAFTEKVIFA